MGEKLKRYSSEEIKSLYHNHCLGSHGDVHKSHVQLNDWKRSIDNTQNLLSLFPDLRSRTNWFRPPYGERNDAVTKYAWSKYGASTLLWNIDSQDWRSNLSVQQIRDRVITLMLLWRSGVILFHDTKAVASQVVPYLLAVDYFTFRSCHDF